MWPKWVDIYGVKLTVRNTNTTLGLSDCLTEGIKKLSYIKTKLQLTSFKMQGPA